MRASLWSACLCAVVFSVHAEEAPPLSEPQRAKLKQCIADLASDTFEKREAAGREIFGLGEDVLPELTAAIDKAADPEAKYRLQKLRQKLERHARTAAWKRKV